MAGGCATTPPGVLIIAGQEWVWDESRPHCSSVTWTRRPWEELRERFGQLACAWPVAGPCEVVSGYSAEEAERVMVHGESLRRHEERHVLERLSHPSGPHR